MLAQTGAPSAFGLKRHLASDIPKTAFAAYKEVNEFLKRFFTGKSQFQFAVQQESVVQQLAGLTPTVINHSVLTIVRTSSYRYCLFNKLQ
jgi:hypothetical protein